MATVTAALDSSSTGINPGAMVVAPGNALSLTVPTSQTDLTSMSRASSVQSFCSVASVRSSIIPRAKLDKERSSTFHTSLTTSITEITPQLKTLGFHVRVIKKYYKDLPNPVEIEFLYNPNTKQFMLFTTGRYKSSLSAKQLKSIEKEIAEAYLATHVKQYLVAKTLNGKFENDQFNTKYVPDNPNSEYSVALDKNTQLPVPQDITKEKEHPKPQTYRAPVGIPEDSLTIETTLPYNRSARKQRDMFKYILPNLFDPTKKDPGLPIFLSQIGDRANSMCIKAIENNGKGQYSNEKRLGLGEYSEEAYNNLEASQNIQYGENYGGEYKNCKKKHQVKMFLCRSIQIGKQKDNVHTFIHYPGTQIAPLPKILVLVAKALQANEITSAATRLLLADADLKDATHFVPVQLEQTRRLEQAMFKNLRSTIQSYKDAYKYDQLYDSESQTALADIQTAEFWLDESEKGFSENNDYGKNNNLMKFHMTESELDELQKNLSQHPCLKGQELDTADSKQKYDFLDENGFLNTVDDGASTFKTIRDPFELITLKIGNSKLYYHENRLNIGLPGIPSLTPSQGSSATQESSATQASSATQFPDPNPVDSTQSEPGAKQSDQSQSSFKGSGEIQPNDSPSAIDLSSNVVDQKNDSEHSFDTIKAIGSPTGMGKLNTTKNPKKQINQNEAFNSIRETDSALPKKLLKRKSKFIDFSKFNCFSVKNTI